jgi:1-acyl-sn-glycerol-3-phosphate acyltransferase
MLEKLGRYWRLFGAGISFFAIGLGGVIVFPALNIVIWNRRLRADAARALVRLTFRSIVAVMRLFDVFHCDVHGSERLERSGLLILANHPSLIDIVLLMALVKRADCIVKSGLWQNPFTRATIRAAGYVRNDSGPGLIEDCVRSLQGGSNLIVFPEGTRTPADGPTAFKRGAANIAVRGRLNVTPVLIRCTPRMVGKGRGFLRALSRTIYFRIDVEEDIDIRPFLNNPSGGEALAARHLTDYLQDYFSEEKSSDAAA